MSGDLRREDFGERLVRVYKTITGKDYEKGAGTWFAKQLRKQKRHETSHFLVSKWKLGKRKPPDVAWRLLADLEADAREILAYRIEQFK